MSPPKLLLVAILWLGKLGCQELMLGWDGAAAGVAFGCAGGQLANGSGSKLAAGLLWGAAAEDMPDCTCRIHPVHI